MREVQVTLAVVDRSAECFGRRVEQILGPDSLSGADYPGVREVIVDCPADAQAGPNIRCHIPGVSLGETSHKSVFTFSFGQRTAARPFVLPQVGCVALVVTADQVIVVGDRRAVGGKP